MQPYVGASRLASLRKCELMRICRKVADAVELGGGAVRDYALVGSALPSQDVWRELEPCSAKLEVVGGRSSRQAEDAVRHALEDAISDEPGEGSWRDARLLRLPASDETPLVGGDQLAVSMSSW